MRRSPLLQDLKELAWAVFLLDVIAILSGALLGTYAGRAGLLVGVAFAALITLTLAAIAGANLLVIAALRVRDRRRRGAEATPSTGCP